MELHSSSGCTLTSRSLSSAFYWKLVVHAPVAFGALGGGREQPIIKYFSSTFIISLRKADNSYSLGEDDITVSCEREISAGSRSMNIACTVTFSWIQVSRHVSLFTN